MFRRPKTPDPSTLTTTETASLQGRISGLQADRDALIALIGYLQNAALQMHSTVHEHAYLAKAERLPIASTLAELVKLRLDVLAILPLALLEERPGAADKFTEMVGYPPGNFENPVLTSAELLGFRIHTASRLLMQLAYNKRVDAEEVRYQAQNDVTVLLEHERARTQQKR